jgi:release factor glutamine methyltransferase
MSDVALVLQRVRKLLGSSDTAFSGREPEWLLEAASGLPTSALRYGQVSSEIEARAMELACRRAGGEPLQYVTGVAGFRRLELEVGPGVLVPRPETETVVERALARLPEHGTVVDVGTGSGAIALAVADERGDADVWATDLSHAALTWARRNAERLGLGVRFTSGDLLAACPGALRGRIDVVVANLPYVATSERGLLSSDVVDHEPHEALFAGPEGLSSISLLAAEATTWLRPGGWLVVETGDRQGPLVRSLLSRLGYVEVCLYDDLAGRQRVAEGRCRGE